MISIQFPLQVLGLIFLTALAYRLKNFIYTYFVHKSTLPRYLHPGTSQSYALVTGATDGLGLATAEELLKRGFNVIVHGRNPEKLERVRDRLTRAYAERKIVTVEASAAEPEDAARKILDAVREVESKDGGKLTVLINNLAGMPPSVKQSFNDFSDVTPVDMRGIIEINALFPMLVTHALLPTLTANKPSLIVNVGSFAGHIGSPFVITYSASKASNHIFSRALAIELSVSEPQIEVLGLLVAEVETAGNPGAANFAKLTPQRAAKSLLDRVGCGQQLVVIDWRHVVTFKPMLMLPEKLSAKFMGQWVQQKKNDQKRYN